MQNNTPPDYDCWMRDVDKIFYNSLGVPASASDFEDWTWMEAYDSGKTPDQAFNEWAEETGLSELI